MSASKLSAILKRLMFEKSIKTMELARVIAVPQPTLQRIVAGTTLNPHHSSLEPIADYFGVSVEQLKGNEVIPWLEQTPKQALPKGLTQIPHISWREVCNWNELKTNYPINDNNSLWVEEKIGKNTFALTLEDLSMYPLFPQGTVVIIDPNKPLKDRSFIVVSLKEHPEPIFRQLVIDANHRYIKAINPDLEHFPMTELQEGDRVCGSLAHARKDFED